jgi:hypothetical protein
VQHPLDHEKLDVYQIELQFQVREDQVRYAIEDDDEDEDENDGRESPSV